MNLIDQIADMMLNDDEDREKESARLQREWEGFTLAQRDAVDAVMICLCGWSLTTLLEEYHD